MNEGGEKGPKRIREIPWQSAVDPAEIKRRNLEAGKKLGIFSKKATLDREEDEEARLRKIDALADFITARAQKEDATCAEVFALASHPILLHFDVTQIGELSGIVNSIDNFKWEESRTYLAAVAWRYKQLRNEQKQIQEPR